MPLGQYEITALELLAEFQKFSAGVISGPALKPANRSAFHWPPHSVAVDYHVQASEWTETLDLEIEGERHAVRLAYTRNGVFGQMPDFGNDARADSAEKVLKKLAEGVKPLFRRQRELATLLGLPGRYTERISTLSPVGLVRLLYAADRDISHQACVEIESHASTAVFGPTLVAVLSDTSHPHRRAAQWAVLDLFEDLSSYFPSVEAQAAAIEAIRNLMWEAPEDYARTIYKAGVVLGGHICTEASAAVLLECFEAPSKFARRSAIHASFHLVEWMPEAKDAVLAGLQRLAESDPDGILQAYADGMASDIARGLTDHIDDVFFPEEQ
ncbi:MAG: hypothetical protein JNJ45_06590 [Chthonomonas sp.]|nr:hypothetical protein [Chthonomonas sp.]